jgi:3-oxoacyl-[acyl-carrier-protein] synthase-3
MIFINNVYQYIPETKINLGENPKIEFFSPEQIQIMNRFYGLKEIPIFEQDESVFLEKIMDQVLASQIDLRKIKYVIYPHTIPILFPHNEHGLKNLMLRYGLAQASFFGFHQEKCVSYVRALEVAQTLLSTLEDEDLILILMAEKSFFREHRLLPGISIIGDAAAAVLVKKKGTHHRLIRSHISCFGKYAQGIWMDAALEIDFQNLIIEKMHEAVDHVLEGLPLEKVKLIFPHNANILCWKKFSKLTKYPMAQIYTKNIERYSHCFNADNFLNFHDVFDGSEKNLFVPGDLYLLISIGVGAYISVALFEY